MVPRMNNSNGAPRDESEKTDAPCLCASRGWPGKWDCLFDLSREENSLGNHQVEKRESWEGIFIITLRFLEANE